MRTTSDSTGDEDFEPQGPQGTRVISRDEIARMLAAEQAGRPAGDQPSLWGLSPPVQGQRYALTEHRTVIGRGAQSQVCVNDPGVSAEHAHITRERDGWRIANLLSTNGTFVNGKQIRGGVRLKGGDRIRLGNVEFAFEAPADATDTTAGAAADPRRFAPLVLAGGGALVLVLAALLLWLLN